MDVPSLLICGKIRDRSSFERDAETYCEWLKSGIVGRIVFSGWTSDLAHNGDLMASMARGGIEIVVSEEPLIKSFGYTLHQTKSLFQGLQEFDDHDWVIKTRTDKVGTDIGFERINRHIREDRKVGNGSPFRSRILARGASLFQPFFINDMKFVGRACDLKKIAHHDLWYVCNHSLLNTEQILFYSAFRSACPFSEAFFTVNPGLQYGEPEKTISIYSYLLGHDLYLLALREFVSALLSSFSLSWIASDNEDLNMPPTWESMLDMDADFSGTTRETFVGLRSMFDDRIPNLLLDIPISTRGGITLRSLDEYQASAGEINRLRDDLCASIYRRWPNLPNVCGPNHVQDGIKIRSTRISLVC